MAFLSHLQFGDNSTGIYSRVYTLVDCHLHFMRHYNHFRPDTDARCEKVEVVVEAPGKDDLTLVGWYVNNEVYDGRILFDLPSKTSESSMQTAQTLLPVVDRCRKDNHQRYCFQEPLCLR